MKSTWWTRVVGRKTMPIVNQRRTRLTVEFLEDRCVPTVTGFSTAIGGIGNNVANPTLGTAGTDLLRVSPADYKPVANGGDGFNTPSLTYGAPTNIATPRFVSNTVDNQATTLFDNTTDINTVDGNSLSDFGYSWGQFIDHDMDLTPTLSGRITAASWNGGVASITVADGLFRAGDKIVVSGMVPTGFNTPTAVTVINATVNIDNSTTLTYALATDPGPATTFGTVADNTTKDGSNGFPIPVDPFHTGVGANTPADPIGSLAFTQSVSDLATGGDTNTPRQQINVSSSYLDLSQVYGSTLAVSNALRTGTGGLMKTSPGADGILGTADDLLPFNNTTYFTPAQLTALGMGNDVGLVTNDQLFAAGDPRTNETTELTSLTTLFVRNHNAIATQLAQQDPTKYGFTSWTDDNLFNEARKLNIAIEQNITYNAYLPDLLGSSAPTYTGYNAGVDPSIATEFSTVAFRFGHSLLNNTISRDANDGSSVGDIPLAQSFFNPTLLTPGATDPYGNAADIGTVLKGDADNNSQAMDVMAVGAVRNLLFGQEGQGEDLISRDIWRADDNGIGTYNQVRVAYGLAPITDTGGGLTYVPGQPFHGFEQISSDPAVIQKLVTAYTSGDAAHAASGAGFLAAGHFAGDINPFVAGLAEDHVPGSDMGPLFTTIIADQFSRLENGDRFFYLNESFNKSEKSFLNQGSTLAKVITANTGVTNLQSDVFVFTASISGKVYLAHNDQAQGGPGQAGVTVELLDSNGNVVGTAVTDSKGNYDFNVTQTGTYSVVVIPPAGYEQTNDPTATITVSGTNVKHVNVAIQVDDGGLDDGLDDGLSSGLGSGL